MNTTVEKCVTRQNPNSKEGNEKENITEGKKDQGAMSSDDESGFSGERKRRSTSNEEVEEPKMRL